MTLVLAFVATVIVPASIPAVVVIPKDERIFCGLGIVCVVQVSNSMKFFHNGSLDNLVLLALKQLSFVIKMHLVVSCVR